MSACSNASSDQPQSELTVHDPKDKSILPFWLKNNPHLINKRGWRRDAISDDPAYYGLLRCDGASVIAIKDTCGAAMPYIPDRKRATLISGQARIGSSGSLRCAYYICEIPKAVVRT